MSERVSTSRRSTARPKFVAEEIDSLMPHLPQNAQRDLLIAGLTLLRERGFHATSTRAVAKVAGMSPAALYVHYESKSALLLELALVGHNAVLEAVDGAIEAAPPDPRSRVLAFVEAYTTWHATHAGLARVVQYELGALEEPGRSEVLAVRRKIEDRLGGLLADGIRDGVLDIDDPVTTKLALLSLGIDVARWFGMAASPDPVELGRRYAALAARMFGTVAVPAAPTT